MTITAAADGSSLGNPGPMGWCWYIDAERWGAGGASSGTNNIGELLAVAELLDASAAAGLAGEPLRILCDSQYVINSVTKWMPGWKRKGWRKSDGKPVLNRELLERIDEALTGREVSFEWVRGHAGHPENEAADERARAAATACQSGRAPEEGPGFGAPERDRGEGAAERAAASGRVADLPVGELTADEREHADGDRFAASDERLRDEAIGERPAAAPPRPSAAPSRESTPGETRSSLLPHERRDEAAAFDAPEWEDISLFGDELPDPDGDADPHPTDDEVLRLERELIRVGRAAGGRLEAVLREELLHEDFSLITAAGETLAGPPAVSALAASLRALADGADARLRAEAIAPNVALARASELGSDGLETRSSSLWLNVPLAQNERAWQLRFRQETPVRREPGSR